MKKSFLTITFLLNTLITFGQKDSLRVLVVTAHPDDESGMAATIYKITHEMGGTADLAVVTNGEAGYKYSTLAEPIYGVRLTDEAEGRKHLPMIRKKELIAAGEIIGIGNIYFLDQQDNRYTLDVDTVFQQVWDTSWVKQRLKKIITSGNYDYIFCLLPQPETHGHHKGASIMALQTVSTITDDKKPVILGVSVSSKSDTSTVQFSSLERFAITSVSAGKAEFSLDRTKSFGYKNTLNYKIIVNWEIAEHKSQGSMQTYLGRGDYENFWYFDVNSPEKKPDVKLLFDRLNASTPK